MVQEPVATGVTVAPDTLHTPGVVELKATPSPELALAVRPNGVPSVCGGMAAKLIVWPTAAIVMTCLTDVAAL